MDGRRPSTVDRAPWAFGQVAWRHSWAYQRRRMGAAGGGGKVGNPGRGFQNRGLSSRTWTGPRLHPGGPALRRTGLRHTAWRGRTLRACDFECDPRRLSLLPQRQSQAQPGQRHHDTSGGHPAIHPPVRLAEPNGATSRRAMPCPHGAMARRSGLPPMKSRLRMTAWSGDQLRGDTGSIAFRSNSTLILSVATAPDASTKPSCCCRNRLVPHPGTRHSSFPSNGQILK